MNKLLPALLALLLGTALAGCGNGREAAPTDVRDRVKVSGDVGAKPTIGITTPLELDKSSSWVLKKGDGDAVGAQATAILQLTLADGRTGRTAVSTLDAGQRPLETKLGPQVFPSLVDALAGRPAGSRVVVASTAEDSYGAQGAPQIGIKSGDPVVMVADVLSTDPTSVLDAPSGPTLTAPAAAPRLVESGGVPSGIDVARLRKPRKLVVVPLREGTGPVVEPPERVTVKYLGEGWGAPKPFESSFTKEPAQFSSGLGGVIPAWDRGLAGLKEGARVMLVCPPRLAYGAEGRPGIPPSSTLVFVVDVLGVG